VIPYNLGQHVRVVKSGKIGEVVAALQFKPGHGVSSYLVDLDDAHGASEFLWFAPDALERVVAEPWSGRWGRGRGRWGKGR